MSDSFPIIANLVKAPIDGTAADPSISFGGNSLNSSGTGMYLKSAGVIGISSAGTEVATINSIGLSGGLVAVTQAITNVTDAGPTQAEMVTALGAASQGSGIIGCIKDANANTNFFICMSNGTSWFYATMTKGA